MTDPRQSRDRTERRRPRPARTNLAARAARYRSLINPFAPVRLLTDEQIDQLHRAALAVLERDGIRVLLPEARDLFAAAGAVVDDESHVVRLAPELVADAVSHAPEAFSITARSADRTAMIGGRHLVTLPVAGPPHVSDLDGGKRPGTQADFVDFVRLVQHFDVMHMLAPSVEPQDVPVELRHLEMTAAMVTLSDKPPFVYARGRGQVADSLEMIRLANSMTEEEFERTPCCWTVINTNSPRQLDIPMCLGIIDFARAGQVAIITPFTLAGAMAPVSLAGALTLQHAEALAGISLAQFVKPGAPVVYGAFTSNVDMRSGAPAFGTPEYFKAALASGQLARHVGLPWRSSAPNASNSADAQASYEHLLSLWGAVMGGCNVLIHAAGWLEGGLTASKEQFILDVEVLQMLAETFQPLVVDDAEIGLDAISSTAPGGHFFGGSHTLERFESAFYAPLVSDWSNFGQWTDAGSLTATQRANTVWKTVLAEFQPPPIDPAASDAVADFVARRTAEGGAPPES